MFLIQIIKPFRVCLTGILVLILWTSFSYKILATDYNQEALLRKELPVQSNNIEGWPDGPLIGADAAILIEANTGTILYSKNIDKKQYPASTTKLLTALLAIENSSLDETVTFSNDAVFSVPWDASGMGADVGEQITMEQALYAVLVGSANEASNAVAEHISGSMSEFADLMNERAIQFGCKNTNFVNANGLFDENHYTTAYDLALIATEFFKYELLSKMSNTGIYNIPITENQPDDIWLLSHHKLIEGKEYAYEYMIGGKTGYTDKARQTLVSCAQKDGMRLISVILKEESPNQFTDTISLFNYGFSNFKIYNVAENETKFNIEHTDFFESSIEVFGNSKPMLSLDQSASIVLPITADFNDATSVLTYQTTKEREVAAITYSYLGVTVGNAPIYLSKPFDFATISKPLPISNEPTENVIFINVKKVVFIIIGIAGFFIFVFMVLAVIRTYHFSRKRRSRLRRKRRKQYPSKYDRFDF